MRENSYKISIFLRRTREKKKCREWIEREVSGFEMGEDRRHCGTSNISRIKIY